MTTIPSLANKTIALSLLSGARGREGQGVTADASPLGKTSDPWAVMTGLSSPLSPGVTGELMKVAQAGDKASLLYNRRAEYERDHGHPLFNQVAKLQFSIRSLEIPPEEQEHLSGAADTYVRLSTPQLEQREFEELVLLYHEKMGSLDHPNYEGYEEALANGTLKIQRAIDVEGLDYDRYAYDKYRDGHLIGFQGWGHFNRDYLESVEEQGQQAVLGSIWGQRFFVTWPDPAAEAV